MGGSINITDLNFELVSVSPLPSLQPTQESKMSLCPAMLPSLMANPGNLREFDWTRLSHCEWALPLLMANPDKFDWMRPSHCEWTLPLLMANPDKIQPYKRGGEFSPTINPWAYLSSQEWALPLLEKHVNKVVWKEVSNSEMYGKLRKLKNRLEGKAATPKNNNSKLRKEREIRVNANQRALEPNMEALEAKLRKKIEAEFEAKLQAFKAKLEATEAKLDAAKAELASFKASKSKVPPTPAPPMTFRQMQVALMEAYGVVDPKIDFKPLNKAMGQDPAKGCDILNVSEDPVGKYHILRKLAALEKKTE